MLSLFQRKKVPPIASAPPAPPIEPSKGLTRPEPVSSLLATPRRQRLLEHIWQRTSVSRSQFITLYRAPLERYAELVQQFPASESHHHAYPGGMLDHGLEIVAYALKLRQSHLLPAGATPEAQAVQAEAWTAGAAYAALLHDVGKVAVDLHVEYGDGTVWHPWHGPLRRPYRFRYRPEREYRLHSAATGLLYVHLLDPTIFDWLSGYPDLWAALLYVLAGQYEHAGVLGELVIQADQASVAQSLGGDPAMAMAAPKHALQRKLLEGLRYLLKEELKLNQPRASDGWLTQDALWLVSKTISDKLRAHLLSQGIDGIPANNSAVFNVMQDHGMLQPTPEGKAIWRATIASDTGWSHAFTLLRLAPALIWEGGDRPMPFAGTVTVEFEDEATEAEDEATSSPATGSSSIVSAVPVPAPSDGVDALLELLGTNSETPTESLPVEELPQPTSVPSSPSAVESQAVATAEEHAASSVTSSGEHFMEWLKKGIHSHRLVINDVKALVHSVADTAYLVSPGVFQRYAQEHPQIVSLAKQENLLDWQWVQRRFEKLQLHRKENNGLNIWTCEVSGPRKSRRLHGYLLQDPHAIFEDTPPNNPYLSLL
ncbi:TraI domain-containing protein [Burkholderia multivorans]|uniref:MobH family relaxase n=1 Tax=Burkholderiaceae TaxID=119060 RepID=UPI00158A1A9F|nr:MULTISPECIES: MobH family relaxase [Burkholderia cepacia complex]MCO8318112.1 TraI domain-containing protein [Burkholderia multivorans]MCO8550446.1 TraI domain-containing protein [Burkholderia multivorans]MCO8557854.1 TraI domain-containing protein [Burkholderia multivorans]MCO8621426.1 TraI domain-containing protein [Burkholderia multivorans]